jgi:hypothetical protein
MSTDGARAPKDFADLYTDLVNRIREQTGVTATDNQAKRYINLALLDMHIGTQYKVSWAERDAVLRTKAKYTTGTISVNKGDNKVIGVGTAFSGDDAFGVKNVVPGGKITLGGNDEVYEVLSVESNTQLTLVTDFISTSILTADENTFIYFEDDYFLADDFLRFVDTRSFNPSRHISIISRTQFRRQHVANDVTGYPTVATIMDRSFGSTTAPVRKVRFSRAPDKEYLIPYEYITDKLAVSAAGEEAVYLVEDTDEPIVPYRYRAILTHYALSIWYRDKKDDLKRAESARKDYESLMTRMTEDQEIGAPRARLQPKHGPYKRRAQQPYSGSGSRKISASGFDEMRDRF